MQMKDEELNVLIEQLESRADMSVAEYDGVAHALDYYIPEGRAGDEDLSTTDGAIHIVDRAYPNWNVHVHGRANDRDGHWRCTLRENDVRDNDDLIGMGRSPVLSQAVLAALLRLTAGLKKL
jgi:hypothetical protein